MRIGRATKAASGPGPRTRGALWLQSFRPRKEASAALVMHACNLVMLLGGQQGEPQHLQRAEKPLCLSSCVEGGELFPPRGFLGQQLSWERFGGSARASFRLSFSPLPSVADVAGGARSGARI